MKVKIRMKESRREDILQRRDLQEQDGVHSKGEGEGSKAGSNCQRLSTLG
jgi:hypothetical protein